MQEFSQDGDRERLLKDQAITNGGRVAFFADMVQDQACADRFYIFESTECVIPVG